ncbi:hypothetical protein [Amycolatopsis sp. WQ 127309]|uniref:hypothetical protein n=1 Tax=Amycolatopsis sp. WQ 127309 TaxID=2932773 RepID=UPI001FF4D865|nr:hypothetical protein [Amycolatopsis sp. WQ 127309]UOZ05556.1 hypothetical protein MUY22_43130 [Amycolatopsis sp. WQ 127309]
MAGLPATAGSSSAAVRLPPLAAGFDYGTPFGNHVVDIECGNSGLSKACGSWKGKISVVQRDKQVVPADQGGCNRKTC